MKPLNILLLVFFLYQHSYAQFALLPDGEKLEEQPTYESLSKALDKSEKIYKLDLFGQLDYTKVPEEIGELFNLRVLLLGKNNIHSLPRSFSRLPKLQHLDLGQNPNFDFEGSWEHLKQLDKLHILFLNKTGLKSIPSDFSRLSELRWLNPEGNPDLNLDEAITNLATLENLKVLNLSWGDFEQLPPSITQLKSVEELYLNDNQIKSLPAELFQMDQLKSLDLSSNPIHLEEIQKLQEALKETKIYF